MRFQSPLSNLCDVLSQIKESARQYRDTLVSNEAATRAVLIDPVLRALGWDTANTNMVEVEKTLGTEVRADYALYDNNATIKIVVEAKKLGANLDHRPLFMYLVRCAFNLRANDIFLTDGLTWQHFDNFQVGHEVPAKILDLANDDVVACAAYLVQHLDAAQFWPVDQNIDVLSSRIDQVESAVATIQKDVATALRAIQAPAAFFDPQHLGLRNSRLLGDLLNEESNLAPRRALACSCSGVSARTKSQQPHCVGAAM